VLYEHKDPLGAVQDLMERALKHEMEFDEVFMAPRCLDPVAGPQLREPKG
jgi:hypothetical protein